MPDKQQVASAEDEHRANGLQCDMEYCYERRSRGNSLTEQLERKEKRSRTNSTSDSSKQMRTWSNSSLDPGKKKNKTLKNVSFNTDLNEYFEPKQNCTKRRVCPADCIKERRNGVSVVKRDSYEVLRILSMYTSWRLAQAQKGRKYEPFAEFLGRASPKLFDKFFIDNQSLL